MQKLGLNAVCYFKVGGVASSGDWLPLSTLKDLTLTLEAGEADVTTRAANGWRLKIATLKEASIEGELLYDSADAGFTAVKNAYFSNALIGILALDGPLAVAGNEGLQCDASVLSFTREEKLEDALSAKIKLVPTYSTSPPSWVRTQAGGILVPAES
ncbi:MAG: hypothetical protein H0X38_05170 [Planctomycetes bacterium]|nr:hypothetical protein [Planctomycetota bacterium]